MNVHSIEVFPVRLPLKTVVTLSPGFPAFSFPRWQAVFGPAGLPREIVRRLNAEIVKAMANPQMKERFLSVGTDAETSTPDALGRFLAQEMTTIRKIARSAGATTN